MTDIHIHFPKGNLTSDYAARVKKKEGENVVEFIEVKTFWQHVKNWFGRYIYSGDWTYKTSKVHQVLLRTEAKWKNSETYTSKQKKELIEWTNGSVQRDQQSRPRKWHDPDLLNCEKITQLGNQVLGDNEPTSLVVPLVPVVQVKPRRAEPSLEKIAKNAEVLLIMATSVFDHQIVMLENNMLFDSEEAQLIIKENFDAALNQAQVREDLMVTWRIEEDFGYSSSKGTLNHGSMIGAINIRYDDFSVADRKRLAEAIQIFQKPFPASFPLSFEFVNDRANLALKIAVVV